MNDLPRQELYKIFIQQGRSLLNNPQQCEELLQSSCGDYRREIFVLVQSLKEQIAVELMAAQEDESRKVLMNQLVKRLQDNLAFTEEAARWAVETWELITRAILNAESEKKAQSEVLIKEAMEKAGLLNPHNGETLVVSQQGGGHYQTLRKALKHAQPGMRILVRPGFYRENLVLDKAVEIAGDGPVSQIIVESMEISCITMGTDVAMVRGLTLQYKAASRNKRGYAVDIPQGQLVLEDCDITSDFMASVAIHGSTANPILRRCRIHDGKAGGILIWDNGRGIIEACDIHRNYHAGIEIKQGGHPVIRQCKIHDGQAGGIFIWDNGRGTIEDCDIYRNAQLFVEEYDTTYTIRAGVSISAGGNPIIRRCKIRDGKASGIAVWDGGEGLIEECEISGNSRAGVEIYGGGKPTLRRCKINRNGSVGVWAYKKPAGIIENCDLTKNLQGAWDIVGWSRLVRSGNKE